jgi:hypothetical protein
VDVRGVGAAPRASVKLQAGWTAASHDLDVLPQDALRLTGAERFHRGLLRGEAPREMWSRIPALGTIGNLTGSEHAVQESVAIAFEDVGDTGNVGGVETYAEDVHDRTTA